MHTPGRVVWLGMELNGLSPGPPRNAAIPMQAGEIPFLILQLSPANAAGRFLMTYTFTGLHHTCILNVSWHLTILRTKQI